MIRVWLLAMLACAFAVISGPVRADDFRPAYLQLSQADATTYDVLWKVPALGEDAVLKVHPAFPSGTTTLVSSAEAMQTALRSSAGESGFLVD